MTKLVFITGPSCAGKSTRFSHLWDSLSEIHEYEDVYRDIDRTHPRKELKPVNRQLIRKFKDINIALMGQKSKTGWVSIDQFKNYKYSAKPSFQIAIDLVKEFDDYTVIADGVAHFYGELALPNNIHESGIDNIDWIMILHSDFEEAVDRSFERLARSGKKRSSKKETTREEKMKTLIGGNNSAKRLLEKFKDQKLDSDNLIILDASSPKNSITKLIGEKYGVKL